MGQIADKSRATRLPLQVDNFARNAPGLGSVQILSHI
jgi:hypothetical protein